MDTRSSDRRPVRHLRPARLRVTPLLAGALLALVAVSPALGHAELVSSDPADKAILDTPPTEVTLTFDEGLVARSKFQLQGPDGGSLGTARPAAEGDETMTLDGLTLAPGAYTIEWTSVAADGDIERGTLTFTVNEPTSAPATPSPTPSQESAAPPASPSPTPTAAPSSTPAPSPSAATSPAGSSTTDVLLPIVAALALLGVIGALVLRRNRTA